MKVAFLAEIILYLSALSVYTTVTTTILPYSLSRVLHGLSDLCSHPIQIACPVAGIVHPLYPPH